MQNKIYMIAYTSININDNKKASVFVLLEAIMKRNLMVPEMHIIVENLALLYMDYCIRFEA